MKITKSIISLTAATAVAATGLVLATSISASAATSNNLRIAPVGGDFATPLSMATTPGTKCTNADSAGIEIAVTGPNITAAMDNNILGFTDYGLVQGSNNNLEYPALTKKFGELFGGMGLSNQTGTYTLTLRCFASDFSTVTDTITQQVNLTGMGATAGTYSMVVPLTSTTSTLSGPTTAAAGANVTLTADVTDGAQGSFQLKEGATNVGSAVAVTAANTTGTVSLPVTGITSGSHTYTAVFTAGAGYADSTSNPHTVTVAATATTTTLTGNGTSQATQAATFHAVVSPSAAAGSVKFMEGATVLATQPVAGGVADYSTNALAVGSHNITAEFVPSSGDYAGSTSAVWVHTVTAYQGASTTTPIEVTVAAGELTISVNDVAPAGVKMGAPAMNPTATYLVSTGSLDEVTVTDTRAGDLGWVASGVTTDLTAGSNAINGYNLGWVPSVVSNTPGQTITAGGAVTAATETSAGSTPINPALGLETARTLGSATAGHGVGTAIFDAALTLNIPTNVPPATYFGVLTFTAI